MVIDVEWLLSLGEVKANFKKILCKSQTSWKALMKVFHDKGEGFMISY